jgi:predicted Rossmann-fold nucleotide-binding protein
MDHAVAEGFLDPQSRDLLKVKEDPQELIDALMRPP